MNVKLGKNPRRIVWMKKEVLNKFRQKRKNTRGESKVGRPGRNAGTFFKQPGIKLGKLMPK